jgi:hypothetical protein
VTFASLSDAIDWAQPRWQERPVPQRLHDWDLDGEVGLRYSAAFVRELHAHPGMTVEADVTESCYHPTLYRGDSPRDCPACLGAGVKTVRRERYRYPMWRAFNRLLRDHATRPHLPGPAQCVVTLAGANWDGADTARRLALPWEVGEALLLLSLRKLHHYYAEAPLGRPSWVDKSQSQRDAEEHAVA